MKRLLPFLFFLTILPVVSQVAKADDCKGFFKNEQEVSFNQKEHMPIKIFYSQSLPKNLIHELELAVDAWNKGTNRKLFVFSGIKFNHTTIEEGDNIISWQPKWGGDRIDEQAHLNIQTDKNSKILASILYVNAEVYKYVDTNPKYDHDLIDAESFFVHILGFTLGMRNNNDDIYSVMYPQLPGATMKANLSKSDLENFECVYGK